MKLLLLVAVIAAAVIAVVPAQASNRSIVNAWKSADHDYTVWSRIQKAGNLAQAADAADVLYAQASAIHAGIATDAAGTKAGLRVQRLCLIYLNDLAAVAQTGSQADTAALSGSASGVAAFKQALYSFLFERNTVIRAIAALR